MTDYLLKKIHFSIFPAGKSLDWLSGVYFVSNLVSYLVKIKFYPSVSTGPWLTSCYCILFNLMSFSFAKSGFWALCRPFPYIRALSITQFTFPEGKIVEDLEWTDREFLLLITKLPGSFSYPRSWYETPETYVLFSLKPRSLVLDISQAPSTQNMVSHIVNVRWKSSKEETAFWTGNPISSTGEVVSKISTVSTDSSLFLHIAINPLYSNLLGRLK